MPCGNPIDENVRGRKIAFVLQDPMTSPNPVKKMGEHFVELIRTHELKNKQEGSSWTR
ncbi:MAG: hypothetical protein QXO76_10340 [Thermoproteota archaeon]